MTWPGSIFSCYLLRSIIMQFLNLFARTGNQTLDLCLQSRALYPLDLPLISSVGANTKEFRSQYWSNSDLQNRCKYPDQHCPLYIKCLTVLPFGNLTIVKKEQLHSLHEVSCLKLKGPRVLGAKLLKKINKKLGPKRYFHMRLIFSHKLFLTWMKSYSKLKMLLSIQHSIDLSKS